METRAGRSKPDNETGKATLLQKAKALSTRHRHKTSSSEEIELALAWANDEITYSQAQEALTGRRRTGMTAYVRLAIALRDYIRVNGRSIAASNPSTVDSTTAQP